MNYGAMIKSGFRNNIHSDSVPIMRRLLWMILLLGGYFWVMTSGNDQALLEKGKWLYETVIAWFDDADVDFQLKPHKSKKHTRSWW